MEAIYIIEVFFDDNYDYETQREKWVLREDEGGGAFRTFESAMEAAKKFIESITAGPYQEFRSYGEPIGYITKSGSYDDGYLCGEFLVTVNKLSLR